MNSFSYFKFIVKLLFSILTSLNSYMYSNKSHVMDISETKCVTTILRPNLYILLSFGYKKSIVISQLYVTNVQKYVLCFPLFGFASTINNKIFQL